MPPRPLPNAAPSPDPREVRIARRLRLVGPLLVATFNDACRVMRAEPAFESATHLVGHLLRELESALRAVLRTIGGPIQVVGQKPTSWFGRTRLLFQWLVNLVRARTGVGGNHANDIKAILAALEIPASHPVAAAWLKLPSRSRGLQRWAHRSALRVRPVDDEFRRLWDEVLSILDYILDRMEARYLAFTPELDRLLQIPRPRKEDVSILKDRIPANVVLRRYFFDKLNHWEWLGLLRTQGFFRYPPGLDRNPEQGTVGAEPWPESGYLARMARIPAAQKLVADIALSIPDTENTRVYEDLIDVALALPPTLAARFVAPLSQWIQKPFKLLLDRKATELLLKLIDGKEQQAALELAAALLGPVGRDTGPEAYLSDWEYGQVIKTVLPRLGRLAGKETLDLLVELLKRSITLERDLTPPEDLSYIWRPAIENHDQNHGDTVPNLLVQALRDTAVQFVADDPTRLSAIVRSLDSQPWYLFHRLALYVLQRFPTADPALLSAHLTDPRCFQEPRYRHEYFQLIRTSFQNLSIEAQTAILALIDAGRPQSEVDAAETTEVVAGRDRYWQLERLDPLREYLPPDWAARYRTLAAELGEPEHADFLTFRTIGWTGPESPKTSDELAQMTMIELREFLASWQAPDSMFGPTPNGLGTVLAGVVAHNPEPYAAAAASFTGLDPTYARSLITGFKDAVKAGTPLLWRPVLELCAWVSNQSTEWTSARRRGEADPDWSWARTAVADLLAAGFGEGGATIPRNLRQEAWGVLTLLSHDPHPSVVDEAQDDAQFDPLGRAINSTRGKAMEGVFAYLRWVRRHNDAQPDAEARRGMGMEEFPEARDLLVQRLDPAQEPTQAVRSLYGLNFPLLVYLDAGWARAHVDAIFPAAEEQRRLFEASFGTYVIYCNVQRTIAALLADKYELAASRLASHEPQRHAVNNPAEQLVDHLVILYLQGEQALDSAAFTQFLAQADDALRAHAIETLGRVAKDEGPVLPGAVAARFRPYWEARLEAARPAPQSHVEELASFGWWVGAGILDQDWVLDQLLTVIRMVRRIEPEHLVLEALAQAAQTHPGKAVACLADLVNPPHTSWLPMSREEFNSILRAALASDQAARRTAEETINRLAALGYIEYRDLLGDSHQ